MNKKGELTAQYGLSSLEVKRCPARDLGAKRGQVNPNQLQSAFSLLAVGAGEAFPVPGVVAVGYPSLRDHLAALDALRSELLLVALGTVDVVLLWNEALCPNGVLAGAADEALLVPLTSLVLHLLHTFISEQECW